MIKATLTDLKPEINSSVKVVIFMPPEDLALKNSMLSFCPKGGPVIEISYLEPDIEMHIVLWAVYYVLSQT